MAWKLFNTKDKKESDQRAPAKPTAPAVAVAKDRVRANWAHTVFVKPLVSEKGAHGSIYDTYAFVVRRQTNKIEVARAFHSLYNIKPLGVRTLLMPEKRKRAGRRIGVRAGWKKALIRVPAGNKVDIFAGV